MAGEASEAVATRFVDGIESQLHDLCRCPGIGAKRDLFAPGLRVTFHGAYALYYVVAGSELVTVRVLHGARDHRAIAERGGFGMN